MDEDNYLRNNDTIKRSNERVIGIPKGMKREAALQYVVYEIITLGI